MRAPPEDSPRPTIDLPVTPVTPHARHTVKNGTLDAIAGPQSPAKRDLRFN
jgi:hypothetical protein